MTYVGLAVAAGLIAYLLGRRKVIVILATGTGLALSIWLGVLAYKATHRQPERPVELTLQLARSQWRLKEMPWYLLQIKNVGYKKVVIHDNFWGEQIRLKQNDSWKDGTYFEVVDPDGTPMKITLDWGQHGEFIFWANDCDGAICAFDDHWHTFHKELRRGEILTATPSVVAPLRAQGRQLGLVDARIPPGATKAEQEAYKKLWEMQGLGRYDPPQKPLYPGYRVLEGYPFQKLGRYRMKAIFQPTKPEFVEARIREGKGPLLGGLPSETKIYRYESNEVEFEVVP